jgi:ABC-type lipoprotein release transport system permease subunit
MGNLVFDPPIDVSGGRALSARERSVYGNMISADWFSTFGVSFIAGRDLREGDRVGSELVAIVNEAFSRKFLNGASPLDHFITLPDLMVQPSSNVPIRIVGVVADAVYASLREPAQPTMYLPLAQHQEPFFLRGLVSINLNVRAASGTPALLARSIAVAIGNIHPQLAVTFRPLADQVDDSLARERVVASLAGFFGVLALMMAALGMYGVTAYAVGLRRTEIGSRMALGASPASVVRMVLSRLSILVGAGMIVGASVSAWASAFVASLLYGLEPRDPATLMGATATLAAVGAIAGWLPAWRASRIDPAAVLRDS